MSELWTSKTQCYADTHFCTKNLINKLNNSSAWPICGDEPCWVGTSQPRRMVVWQERNYPINPSVIAAFARCKLVSASQVPCTGAQKFHAIYGKFDNFEASCDLLHSTCIKRLRTHPWDLTRASQLESYNYKGRCQI